MSRRKNVIEILSPGKNLFYAKEAIRCGADSIYIGAPKFSLRHEHGNSIDDIKELIEFAHKYWVNVYIPLNCLLYTDEDIKIAKNMIDEFYKIGVDGIIIQDIGILELDLPPIPIILSTNTGCYKKEDAQFYEKCGVKRIVLPRELTYNEIKDITDNSNIQIETFCYGFLCVGYSGNCYLAYIENLNKTKSVNSAHYQASNHGVCPERCMGNWTLRDANGKIIRENDRLFNLRFLSLHNEIEKLFDIGVDSFKIAGREKDLKHVKNSTAIFSEVANAICQSKGIKRASSGRTILGFKPNLSKNFNKGFTDFFFNGRKKEMYSKYDIVGTKIGKVLKYKNSTFEIDSNIELNIGDRLRYKKDNNKVQSIEITDKKDTIYTAKGIIDDINGLELYRYIDTKGFKEVEESINYRVISTEISFVENSNKYIIYGIDEDENAIRIEYNKGKNEINATHLKDLLYELNQDCEFVIDNVICENNIFIDDINELRNIIFEKLREERKIHRPILLGQAIKNDYPYYKEKLNYLANVTNNCTKAFYKRHGVKEIEDGLETGISLDNKRVFSSRYCLRNELGLCSKENSKNIPPLPWQLEQLENGNKFRVEFDCKNCSMYLYMNDKG